LKDAFDRFLDVRNMTDREIVDVMRDAGVHIAVDLKGLTHGNRMGVFAQRCAPIQVNYLGFPGTTGAAFMDYLIADRILIPENERGWYAEKIVYLPDTYQVNDRRRAISQKPQSRAELCLPMDSFVYCCFNASYKISPRFFALWMRLLARVPSSVLWLLDSNREATQRLRQTADSHGIDRRRIIFAPWAAPAEHIARYRFADVFLDTLPVGAHTTASEALWAGLPVLTCVGQSFSGRVAASLLTAANLPELVTHTLDQYENLAFTLATAPGPLKNLRERLARQRFDCALFDTDRFRRHLEAAYRQMWSRYENGEEPEHLAVEAIRAEPTGDRIER